MKSHHILYANWLCVPLVIFLPSPWSLCALGMQVVFAGIAAWAAWKSHKALKARFNNQLLQFDFWRDETFRLYQALKLASQNDDDDEVQRLCQQFRVAEMRLQKEVRSMEAMSP